MKQLAAIYQIKDLCHHFVGQPKMIKDNKMFCNQESRVKMSKTCLAG